MELLRSEPPTGKKQFSSPGSRKAFCHDADDRGSGDAAHQARLDARMEAFDELTERLERNKTSFPCWGWGGA